MHKRISPFDKGEIAEISIVSPDNFRQERDYVIDVLFNHIIKLPFKSKFSNSVDKTIISYNGNTIEFADSWRFADEKNKGNIDRLPHPIYGSNKFTIESDIPIIFGNDEISIRNGNISCGIDIIASIFFMLSRWEERQSNLLDEHGRFPGCKSTAYRFGFLRRPVVNEYAEMIVAMLYDLGFPIKKIMRQGYRPILTHDIDNLENRTSIFKAAKMCAWSILKKHDWKNGIASLRLPFIDDFDLYDFFMDVSEQANVKSHFYFMSESSSTTIPDHEGYLNNDKLQSILTRIKSRGHEIGFHPSYFTLGDKRIFEAEYHRLFDVTLDKPKEGRQHYLRVKFPETMKNWSDNGFQIDSSMGYADVDGFRCGTGCEIPLFDYINRASIRLVERPLVVMDCTLSEYQNMTSDEIHKTLIKYIEIGKKYKMPITFLYHNSYFVGKNRALKRTYYKVFTNNN